MATNGTVIDLLVAPPTPSDIAKARAAAGLTQTQAGLLVGYTLRGWQDAESGRRNISPAAWALFLLATGQHAYANLDAKSSPRSEA